MPENNNDLMNNSQDLNTVSGVENVTKKGGKKAAAIGIGAVVLLAGGGAAGPFGKIVGTLRGGGCPRFRV